MTKIVPLDVAPSFDPRENTALPERLVEGNPFFKTWELDTAEASASNWEKIRSGIWEATPGTTVSIKGETFEFCHILSGVVEISEEGGETFKFTAGDSFVMKPGFVGQWKTIETVRKIFIIAS